MLLPDTPETQELVMRYEQDRLRREQAVKELVVFYEVPAFTAQAGKHTHLFKDGEGNHYEAVDIANAVIEYHLKLALQKSPTVVS